MGLIHVVSGDMFKSNMQTITNTINCVGAQGAGLAKIFARKYPAMSDQYKTLCGRGAVVTGAPYLCKLTVPYILMFPTKNHWKHPSQMSYIEEGLSCLVQKYKEWGITSLAMPALGCGYGGLSFDEVEDVMRYYCGLMDIPIEIYKPKPEQLRVPKAPWEK